MIVCYFAGDDNEVMLSGDAPYNIAHTNGYITAEELFTILWYPHEMDIEVRFRVRSESILSHTIMLAQE